MAGQGGNLLLSPTDSRSPDQLPALRPPGSFGRNVWSPEKSVCGNGLVNVSEKQGDGRLYDRATPPASRALEQRVWPPAEWGPERLAAPGLCSPRAQRPEEATGHPWDQQGKRREKRLPSVSPARYGRGPRAPAVADLSPAERTVASRVHQSRCAPSFRKQVPFRNPEFP